MELDYLSFEEDHMQLILEKLKLKANSSLLDSLNKCITKSMNAFLENDTRVAIENGKKEKHPKHMKNINLDLGTTNMESLNTGLPAQKLGAKL